MFDGIHRPEGYNEKPKSAAWAQPVTEVHTSKNPNAKEPIHPVRPTAQKKGSLPILLLVLFLLVLGGGGYYWYTNYYAASESNVVADNSMMQQKDNQAMEKEDMMEKEMIFPGDYFLNREEILEDFSGSNLEPKKESSSIELHDLYDNPSLSGALESWSVQYLSDEDYRIVVMATLFSTEELLDIEEEKISQTEDLDLLGKRDSLAFVRQGNVLLTLASDSKDDILFQEILSIYEKKFNTEAINILQGEGLGGTGTAAVKADMTNLVSPSAVYYDDNNSYLGFCDSQVVASIRKNIDEVSEFVCFDNDEIWAASAKLDDSFWCVDSMGKQKEVISAVDSGSCDDLEEYISEEDLTKEEEIIDPEYLQDREILLCYVIYDNDAISYYPSVDLRTEHMNLIADLQNNYTDEEALQFFYNECDAELLGGALFAEIKRTIYLDEDEDGLTAYFENIYGSSDEKEDTDGDGYDDKTEVENGYSPIDNLATSTEDVIAEEENDLAAKRNSQRLSDVNTILNAIYQYAIDNSGQIPSGITEIDTEICVSDSSQEDCGSLVWLGELLEDEKYLVSMPIDPNEDCALNGVCYTVMKTTDNRVQVSAPNAELENDIKVKK